MHSSFSSLKLFLQQKAYQKNQCQSLQRYYQEQRLLRCTHLGLRLSHHTQQAPENLHEHQIRVADSLVLPQRVDYLNI